MASKLECLERYIKAPAFEVHLLRCETSWLNKRWPKTLIGWDEIKTCGEQWFLFTIDMQRRQFKQGKDVGLMKETGSMKQN